MAPRPSSIPPRRFASPALKALMQQRTSELGGLVLGLLGLGILVALATYNPQDPSLNTATTRHVTNLAGQGGAVLADILLQGFGVAGVLPGFAMLAWCWRLASRRGLGAIAARIAALLAAMPLLAAVIAALPLGRAHPWPVMAGPGGSIGQILATEGMNAGHSLFGILGALCVWLLSALLALALTLLALGLSRSEWRSAGTAAAAVARFSVSSGRGTVDVLSRHSGRFSGATDWLTRLAHRGAEGDMGHEEPTLAPALASRQRPMGRQPASQDALSAAESERSAPPVITASGGGPSLASGGGPSFASASFGSRSVGNAGVTPLLAQPGEASSGGIQSGGAQSGGMSSARVTKPPAPARKPVQSPLPLQDGEWNFPPLDLLKPAPTRVTTDMSEEALQANARLLETVLSDYGVQGEIVEIRPGPVVTLYELVPAPGIRSARVIGLADDVARSLSVTAVRIATVPGRNVIGIEVPNSKRETVYLSEILSSEEVLKAAGRLSLALGKDIGGKAVVADLSRMPHL
ncbi:MAG TPA: DNA translocase FtsK 4TM domain-containing protein, partial [Rhodopila sp.]|nr:DNA translocase FtsK 4TM domain-containing protein [Rhodopila sp.]